jgi:hypothetical protein
MPVKPDSRFAELPILQVLAPDGTPRRVVALRLARPPALGLGARHRVTQHEEVDALARKYLGDERLWWRVLDANPTVYPLDLAPGMVLSIPAPGPATRVTRARRF